jgi:hypothetical protein
MVTAFAAMLLMSSTVYLTPAHDDLSHHIPQERVSQQGERSASDDTPNGDYGGYYTWTEIKAKIAEWRTKYPNLVQEGVLGKTYEGRDIPLLRLSDDAAVNESEPEVLLMAGIHPREQQPQVCIVRLIDEMLAGYGRDERMTRLLKERQIWVIPVLNVDGKVYDMKHGNGKNKGADWRKNRRPNGDGTFGVDLNRNFAMRWGGNREIDPLWRAATTDTKANIYEGPGPLSEPENRALAKFMTDRKNLRAFMDIHSPLRILLFPAYSIGPEYARFRKIVEGMKERQKDPYPTSKDAKPDTEPPARVRGGNSGLTYTWAYYTRGIYGFNFEIGLPNRYPPVKDIEAEYEKNVREPLLFFLESVGELTPATPGTVTCEGEGKLSGKLTPGAVVSYTPPPVQGACDWMALVSEKREIVVPSEYRLAPLKNGFTLQVDKDARPGTKVPFTLYLWDKDRHVSEVRFTLTVE